MHTFPQGVGTTEKGVTNLPYLWGGSELACKVLNGIRWEGRDLYLCIIKAKGPADQQVAMKRSDS